MKVITQDRYGSPEVLELREMERPDPVGDQVYLRVVAASLNMYDWHMTTGTPYLARTVAGLRVPKHPIPGTDVAGIVEAVGDDVQSLSPGDEVFGSIGYGAFAEYVCASEGKFVAKPAGVSFEQAAATPMAGLTALEGLRDVGSLRPGQRVLVNGASGGVGTFAVQIAKALGAAQVTAVCSSTKVDTARSIGADHVIDYTREDFTATERDHHLLFDNVGLRPWRETRMVLADEGIQVMATGPKKPWLGPFGHFLPMKLQSIPDTRTMTWFTARMRRSDLVDLAGFLESGVIEPVIEDVYPLEKTPDALRRLGEGHAAGKLVITV